MNDNVKTVPPRLLNCPYCQTKLEAQHWVDVLEDGGEDDLPTVSESAGVNTDMTFTTVRCVRFLPCGHAFEESSISAITDALRELRSLRRERRWCEDADRLRQLDYELEEQIHAVNNRVGDAVRRQDAEEDA